MAAPVFTGNVNQVHYDGPGIILGAVYSDTLVVPTYSVAASAFTNDWDTTWQPIGFTDDGFELTFNTTSVDIEAAESIYPLATVNTKQEVSVKFSMLQDNKFNMARAMNGGTFTVVSGSTTTKLTKYSPPIVGGEIRSSIAWLSAAADEIVIVYKVHQSGNLSFTRKKLGTKWALACDFRAEVPAASLSTDLFNRYYAGTKAD